MISSGPDEEVEETGVVEAAAMAGVAASAMAVRPAPATLRIFLLVLVGCTASCSMRVPPVCKRVRIGATAGTRSETGPRCRTFLDAEKLPRSLHQVWQVRRPK